MDGCFAFLTFKLNPDFCLWVLINRASGCAVGYGGHAYHLLACVQGCFPCIIQSKEYQFASMFVFHTFLETAARSWNHWIQSDVKDMSSSYRVSGSRKCNSLLCAFPTCSEMSLQSPLPAFSFSFVHCFLTNFIAVCSAIFVFRIIVSFVFTFQSKATFSSAPHISFALKSTLCYINSVIICCIWLIFLSLFCFELNLDHYM